MAQASLTDEVIQRAVLAVAAYGGNVTKAARSLGIPRATFKHQYEARFRATVEPPPQPLPEIAYEPEKPKYRVRATRDALLDLPSRRVVVIGDTHWKPSLDDQHMSWIGRYIAETRPDNVIHIGDALDFESCEFHTAPGSATHAARPSFAQDIEAGEDALSLYHKEVGVGEIPHDITFGNHEERVWRYEEVAPNLAGTLVLQLEQLFARYRWKTNRYRRYIFLDNVGFMHIPQSIMLKPIGGKNLERTLANDLCHSQVIGHSHRWNHITAPKHGHPGITVTNVGSAMPYGYIPKYAEGAMTGYTWGIADLTLRGGMAASANLISMIDLERKYK